MTTPTAQPPKSTEWGQYMSQLYQSRQPPQPLGTVVFSEIEEKARQALKDHPEAFLYAFGSAGSNSTYRANLRAFEKYRIIPRMLVKSPVRDLSVTLFGTTYSSPVLVAPIGVNGIFAKEGEFAAAGAAAKLGVPFILSTASSRSMEDVAAVNGDGPRWYQLYWPKSEDLTLSLLSRAKKNGFKALVVTLDTFTLGWRPHDLETSYLPFAHGVGCQLGFSDPVFMSRFPPPNAGQGLDTKTPEFPYDYKTFNKKIIEGDPTATRATMVGMAFIGETTAGLFKSWDDLEFLKKNWDGPIILKGIQSVDDAKKAIEYGISGIVVSNHGGRQIDGAIPSLYALAKITADPVVRAAQDAGSFTVLYDSGIRTGSDIIKAIALGAQAVLLGRPWLYGAVVGGQAGVEQVLRHTLADLDISLGLSGYQNLRELWHKGEEAVTKVDF